MHKVKKILGGTKNDRLHHQIGKLECGSYVVGAVNIGDEIHDKSQHHETLASAFDIWKNGLIEKHQTSRS